MKKSVLAAAIAGVMLLSGCSGVSQDEYNSLLEENSKLKESSSSSESTSSETSTSSSTKSSLDSNTSKESSSTDNSTSSEPKSDTSTEKYNKDVFIAGAKQCDDWYYKETETGSIEAVLYVDDYAKLDDVDEFVKNFYTGMYNVVIEAPHHGMYTYWVFKENGSLVTTTFLSSYMNMPVLWLEDYEPLNDDELAKQFNDIWCSNNPETSTSQSSSSSKTEDPVESQTPPVQNTATTGEKNALKKAKSYLEYSAFSRDGLIGQLEFEGYTNSEATYGADNVGADWNEQAIKKAGQYLEYSAFSYTGLVEQLEFEKFTHEQAVYGVDNCGADWNEQAVKKAAQYLEYSSFSKDGLIGQLEFEGFTHDQAVYGVTQNGY